mgnify:CR=1 FL=1
MQRFYFPDLEKGTDSVTVKNKDFINQLTKVLRVQEWYEIVFFNGEEPIDSVFKIISIGYGNISPIFNIVHYLVIGLTIYFFTIQVLIKNSFLIQQIGYIQF